MEDINIERIMQGLSIKYYELYPDMPKIPINIVITNCLSKSYHELRPDLKEKLIKDKIENVDDFNGLMVLPNAIGTPINILFNTTNMINYTKDGSMTWVGTFAHELTHAIDYSQMAIKENLNCYDPLNRTDKYYMFQLWSEFHARKFGYKFLREQLNVDGDYDERDILIHIHEVEWPTHANRYHSEYHSTSDGNRQMYSAMQLLGRYSVWCDLYPSEFNEIAFKEIWKNNVWMSKIFIFLQQHNSLETVYPYFEDMRLILKENWKSL